MNFTTFGWKPNRLLQRKCKVPFIIVFIISMYLWHKGDINTVGLSLFYIIVFQTVTLLSCQSSKANCSHPLHSSFVDFKRPRARCVANANAKQPQAYAISNTKLAGLKINLQQRAHNVSKRSEIRQDE